MMMVQLPAEAGWICHETQWAKDQPRHRTILGRISINEHGVYYRSDLGFFLRPVLNQLHLLLLVPVHLVRGSYHLGSNTLLPSGFEDPGFSPYLNPPPQM